MTGTANIVISKSADASHTAAKGYPISVTISTIRVRETINNDATIINIPRSQANYDQGVKTLILDLLRVNRMLDIDGEITSTASITAVAVRDNLRQLALGGGTVSLVYGANTFTGGLLKVDFTEDASDYDTDVGTPTTDVSKYTVKIGFQIGVDINSR